MSDFKYTPDPGLTIRTSRAFLKDPARPGITPYGAGGDVEIIAGAFAGQKGHIHEVDGMTAVVRTGDRDEWARRDAVIRVGEESRAKEAAFHEEHGMSSAEYFHESGYSDADAERAAEEAAQEDEDEYGEAQAVLEEEL